MHFHIGFYIVFTLVSHCLLYWFYTGFTLVLHNFSQWFFTLVLNLVYHGFYTRLPMPSQPGSLHPACAQPTSQPASRQPSRLPSPQATPDGKLPWHLLLQTLGFIRGVANISYLETRPCIKKIASLHRNKNCHEQDRKTCMGI